MAIKTYSLSKDGNTKLSAHFKVKEMACNDGSDEIKASEELFNMLEIPRSNYNITKAVINSGYRTVAYNTKIGGASSSQHCKGTAADVCFYINGVKADHRYLCCLAQTLGFKGIGYISKSAIHLDMRTSGRYMGDETKDYSNNVGYDFFKYFNITLDQMNKYFGIVEEVEEPVIEIVEPEEIEDEELEIEVELEDDDEDLEEDIEPVEDPIIKLLELIIEFIKKLFNK